MPEYLVRRRIAYKRRDGSLFRGAWHYGKHRLALEEHAAYFIDKNPHLKEFKIETERCAQAKAACAA